MTYFIAPNPYHMARRWAHMAGFEPSNDCSLSVDVREDEDAYILNALVPGLKADDLNIQVLDDVVTLTGEFQVDEPSTWCANCRTVPSAAPCACRSALDASKAEAKITDGVLTLRLAKAESARPRTIKVAVN